MLLLPAHGLRYSSLLLLLFLLPSSSLRVIPLLHRNATLICFRRAFGSFPRVIADTFFKGIFDDRHRRLWGLIDGFGWPCGGVQLGSSAVPAMGFAFGSACHGMVSTRCRWWWW